jgi:hypothetical protein
MQTASAPTTYSIGSQTYGVLIAHVGTQFSSTNLRNAVPLVVVAGDAGIARESSARESQAFPAAEDRHSLAPAGLRNSDCALRAGRSSPVKYDSPSTLHRNQPRTSLPPQQHVSRPSLPPQQQHVARQSSSLMYKERMDEKRPFALSSPPLLHSPIPVRGEAAARSPGGKRGSTAALLRPPALRVPSLDEQLVDGESSRANSPYFEHK